MDAPLDDENTSRFINLVNEMSEKVQFIFVTHNKISMEKSTHLLGVTMRTWSFKSCICRCRTSNGVSSVLNPLYEYLIYLVLGLTIGGIIVLKLIDIYKKRDDIQISKDLREKKKAKLKQSLESETGKAEEINEVRVPRQGELDLPDANEGKFIVLHLKAKLDNKPSFELLKQK